MKTILYNPIFINPQAYYVFPRLTRYLQPDNESTSEPANYIGTIEVKVIAYGDTTLKRTYTNTDSIDLSEFKNTWIRISLFTKVGSCVLGEWKIGNMESDLPYIDPEVLASLKAVVIVGNKTNNDSDRAIVKNLVDPDNPFVISNAAFKLNSGFGKYEITFQYFPYIENVTNVSDSKVVFGIGGQLLIPYSAISENIPSFKIKVNGLSGTYHFRYYYRSSDGVQHSVNMAQDGYYELPICYNVQSSSDGTHCGFANNGNDVVTITQIPSFEGAFVTDGVNDLITSTKTVQEMLGGSNEITVVSMMANLDSRQILCNSNFSNTNGYNVRNTLEPNGVISMLGYTDKNGTTNNINLIMGDKDSIKLVDKVNFNSDYVFYPAQYYKTYYQVAWYWTIIANKVLTTDEINQVIAYFNLDKTLKPDILCNTIKQGITNENHAEFGDKLIDFSGNGRDIQLNNIAWDGDSGIGKYNYPNWKVNVTQGNKYARIVYYDSINGTYSADFKGITDLYKSYGLSIEIRVNRANTVDFHSIKEDGIYTMTPPDDTTSIDIRFGGENVYNVSCDITITQIPSHAGALCLDGVNDFGKVTGMPIYKDYTVVADYKRLKINIGVDSDSPILSKSESTTLGAFIFNTISINGDKVSYSFGRRNIINADDTIRKIFYQSKYINDGQDINIESTFVDSDKLWLGSYRDSDYRFIAAAIYSLMSFPYSMSEFLIERQLKKHKLGTLYPNMVEFRPVIKHDDRITAIKYYHIKGSSWIDLKPGDYIPVGSKISITTNLKFPYTIANVVSSSLTDIKVVPSAGGGNAYDILGYVTDKSPQKINLTIEQDENYVLFNPVINSNYKYISLDFFLNNYQKKINIGDYIPKDAYLRANLYLNNNVDEPAEFTFNGVSIGYSRSITVDTVFNIGHIYNYDSPQEVNIIIDEYIRYEDIVQPYPVLLRFKDENGNEVSWGGKFKVGSTITRIGSFNDCNLLKGIYTVSNAKLNGSPLPSTPHVVEKSMVFTCTATWAFDNNEPKCILSPRLLRIPNSSYKILGHIPDMSGHGNHGVIHNSAYAEGSGVNEDGSYQFDGVDDFVAIPTLSSGGKQVLMKVNWNTINSIIYDQRGSGGFAIYCSDYINPSDSITVPAYKGRNAAGTTYIDGIRNEYIIASQLRNVTHNIVEILDTSYAAGNINPIIGKSYMNANYGSLALYDFMLFDDISTDNKIKELNEYVGIEAKVELPPYYWDAYGKTNLDADKATIQQRGVAVGDYDLTNTNFAYDKMSGFGGYEFEKFTDTTKWIETKREDGIEVIEKNDYSFTAKKVGTGQYFWDFKNNSIKTLDRDLTVKAISNNNVYIRWEFKYRTAEKPDIDSAIILLRQAMTPNVPITVTLPYKTQEEQTELGVVEGSAYYLFYFDPSDIPVGDEYTVEMLPLYTNGLVYDGITDYSKNANIPALDDFTAIIKREWLKKQGCPLIKGSKVYEGGNGNALLLEWDKAYNFVFYKRTDIMEGELPDNISFITPTNYNGNVITRGSEQDTNGICIAGDGNAGFANMVFYKLILYPKTIPLLQINFLKNLMERDEIIDLNNLIFIQE